MSCGTLTWVVLGALVGLGLGPVVLGDGSVLGPAAIGFAAAGAIVGWLASTTRSRSQ